MTHRDDSSRQAPRPWGDRTAAVLDAAPDALLVIDPEGRIVDWNRRAEQIFGWTRRDVATRRLAEAILPQDERAAGRELSSAFQAAQSRSVEQGTIESDLLRRDGSRFPAELSISPLHLDDRQLVLVRVCDVAHRKASEAELRRELLEAKVLERVTQETATAESHEDSLHACIEIICQQTNWPVGHVLLMDETRRQLVSTDTWYLREPTRFSRIREISNGLRFGRGEGLPGRIWQSREPAWVKDISQDDRFSRAKADNGLAVRAAFGFPVVLSEGVAAVLEFFSDEITEPDERLMRLVRGVGRRVGELIELRRSEEHQVRLAAIVDGSYDAIIAKDPDGTIVSWNRGAERVYGYASEEAIGENISLILLEGTVEEEQEILDAMRTGVRLEQFVTRRRHKDGRVLPVSVTISPISNRSGRIVGSSTIERDITDLKEHEQALHRAKERAEQSQREAENALKVRGEFLANVSHELRTPMNSILGMLQLACEEDNLSNLVRDYLETAQSSAVSLLDLLNDILDFSRLEAGRFRIEVEPFSLRETVDDAMKTVSAGAFAKGLELACDIAADAPDDLVGDAVRLRQVLINLAGNAVKFTERGEVLLTVSCIRLWPNEARLRFSARDTGIGIAPPDRQRIFDAFAQADASSTRTHGGVGLGLSISSAILRQMGSMLQLKSELAKGSEFHFTVSLARQRAESSLGLPHVPLDQLREMPVLVVDDNQTNRRILEQMLRAWQMRPTTASDGQQALAILRDASETGQRYPLVIVDALMPGMDGIELSRRIAEASPAEVPPIVMMLSSADRQAFAQREDDLRVRAFLTKPVSQSDLLDAIVECLGVSAPLSLGSSRQKALPPPRPLAILVAEDTPANQKVVQAILGRRGHAVTIAQNGREAVNLASRQDYDVILMDIQMPIMDGYQATAAIRTLSSQTKRSVLIVAMTAHAMRGDRERCLAAGMDAYIAKPVDVDKLLALVEGEAQVKRTNDQSDSAGAVSPESATGGSDQQALQNVVDMDDVMQRLAGDRELFGELAGFFLEDVPGLMDDLERAIALSEMEGVHHAAHSIKGMAANLGARAAADAARRLELQGQQGQLDEAPAAFAQLRRDVDALLKTLPELTRRQDHPAD